MDWFYIQPNSNAYSGVLGADYFSSEDAVMKYVDKGEEINSAVEKTNSVVENKTNSEVENDSNKDIL